MRRRPTGPDQDTRDAVIARAQGCCEICGTPVVPGCWYSLHHRSPRRMGGTHNPDVNAAFNLLLLCGTGSSGCHGMVESKRLNAYRLGWLVRSGFDPADTSVLIVQRGRVWLTDDGQYREAA